MNKQSKAKIEKRQDRQRQAMGFGQAAASKGLNVEPQYAIIN